MTRESPPQRSARRLVAVLAALGTLAPSAPALSDTQGTDAQNPTQGGTETAESEEPTGDLTRKNWMTFTFSPDLALVMGSNLCTTAGQSSGHDVCLRADRSRYVGTPTAGTGDDFRPGVALGTLRFMVGYDRLLHPNVTLGLRVGVAVDGASDGGASFLPVHAEGRLGIWPGHEPFARSGARPFIVVSGGLAEVDARFPVAVLEDGRACGAADPASTSSPCTRPSRDGVIEPRLQTLNVYKQAGIGFAALAFGVDLAVAAHAAVHLGARAGVTFPVVVPTLSPEAGLAMGF